MKLIKVQINNFRSIKSQEIVFEHNCLVLLGKNEAGKTNILRAIAAVFGEYLATPKDKRKKIKNETIKDDDCYIRAIFKPSKEDFDSVLKVFQDSYSNTNLIKFQNNKTLRDCVTTVFREVMFKLSAFTASAKPIFMYWKDLNSTFSLVEPITLDGTDFVNEGGKAFNLESIFVELLKKRYEEQPYKCHYWLYKDDYLLPDCVEIAGFIKSPEQFRGLQNIFALCNRGNIKKEFEDEHAQNDGDYANLLEQVSEETTRVFRSIWKDFKDTAIVLEPNGDEFTIKIKNKTRYAMEERSDGFKKFISILLMLSAPSRAKEIGERDIILIDEPDQSLYPTSATFLKHELLNISKKSQVIYSTHSQFMIDSECIDRHLIVEKKDDVTTIHKENENSPFSDDELLRRAIGSSIFECLQPINIIFEGYLDKQLFEKYCALNNKTAKFSEYGKTYLKGISGAEILVPIMMLANKKFVIVADSDSVSISKRNSFESDFSEYKSTWFAYGDTCAAVETMEDFFNKAYAKKQWEKIFAEHTFNENLSVFRNIKNAKLEKADEQEFKKQLVANSSRSSFTQEYDDCVEALFSKIEELKK